MAVLWAHSFPLVFTTKVKILLFQSFMYEFPAHKLYSTTSRALCSSSASKRFQKSLCISSGITSSTTEGMPVLTLLLQRVQGHLNTILLISVLAKPEKMFLLQWIRGTMGKES